MASKKRKCKVEKVTKGKGKRKGKEKGKGKGKQNLNHQISSPLLRLPGELRNQIYTCLFASTTLTFGIRSTGYGYKEIVKPSPNSLAFLRTCCQIYHEAGPLWLGQVLFNFDNSEALYHTLLRLRPTVLSQIRHLYTRGCFLNPKLTNADEDDDETDYSLIGALRLIRDLCLDKLTIFGSDDDPYIYETLEELIKHGNGWRELHFILPHFTILGFGNFSLLAREPQPSAWNETLLRRDGEDSGASVTIYRSTRCNVGTVINPHTRQIFDQKISGPADLANFGLTEDEQLSAANEMRKELLVIVKRGHGVSIAGQDRLSYDIPPWALCNPWSGGESEDLGLDFLDEDFDSMDEDMDFLINVCGWHPAYLA